MKEVYIDRGITQSRIALFEDNKIKDLYIENHDSINLSGNIYKGRVENYVSSLNAVFINIGIGKNGILHYEEFNGEKNTIKIGMDIIVQVVREATEDKGPKLSQKISIPGKFIVLLPDTNHIGISNKINNNEIKQKLYKLANIIHVDNYGFIIRTEAQFAKDEDIIDEYHFLIQVWEKKLNASKLIKPPVLLFNIRDFFNFAIREFMKNDVEIIYVNREKDYNSILEIISSFSLYENCKVKYDEYYFVKSEMIDKQIEKLLERKKILPSGGNIVVDKTEALTAIDINSGNAAAKASKEEYVTNTNVEACKAIANIIKLCNISGIIIIDFIDMENDEQKQTVIKTLDKELSGDRVLYKIYGITNLGLLEMTRAKKGKSLYELIFQNNFIKKYTTAYILKLIENQCVKISKYYKRTQLNININSEILKNINSSFPDYVSEMKNIYDLDIKFIPSYTLDNFEIIK